jgi:FkbM family methyltransferase
MLELRNYVALGNMIRNYPRFLDNLKRYLTTVGSYPYAIEIRTPIGAVAPILYSYHDMLTANEIFCRLDYRADNTIKAVLDVGSNIGISALYFLTRNSTSRCYLYEPDKRNTTKLRQNLKSFEGRYQLVEKAVSDQGGMVDFGIEETGRYGGIGLQLKETIKIESLNINDVIDEILAKEERIDVLKIDTEGAEIRTIESIAPRNIERIRRIYLEAVPTHDLLPHLFDQIQYGGVCQLVRRNAQPL